MTEPPPRKRFQIHLSTAIVMMFVAGGLIWANTTNGVDATYPKLIYDGDSYATTQGQWGWPIQAVKRVRVDSQPRFRLPRVRSVFTMMSISYSILALNVVVSIITLLAVYFLSEWLIRRRAARKGA